ncbi:sigma-54-dependent transcriptional regulator [Schlesneria paludicola]|uniref:sigma-54-dependent transcriptional regulator n=1 Tax=Schlesneria paludicola TaxID=360056 RepID=UPI00029A755A|nr:sigma-54 dependent transcriptional regulator [Schlesneria paludicola]
MSRILIIDDEPAICWSLKERLADQGHDVRIAASVERAEQVLNDFSPEVITLDVRLPGQDGLSAIPEFRERLPETPIVIMTAFGDLQTVVDAMSRGAFEYLVKPFELPEFLSVVSRALQSRALGAKPAVSIVTGDQMVGRGPAMQAVFKQIALVAPTEFPVLITGETGTGKELVAEAIHRHSQRRTGPFLRVSLASLSPSVIESELFGHVKGAFTGAVENRPGLFDLAENGTIFLDEIGETPLPIQVKLLRVLESRCFTRVGSGEERTTNARLVAATNRDLTSMIADDLFRDDLYHRLKVFAFELPPLRARREDLKPLVEYFLSRHGSSAIASLTDEFWQAIEQRPWNGNVRELRNAIDHAVVLSRGGPLMTEHLPPAIGPVSTMVNPGKQLGVAVADWVQQQLSESSEQSTTDLYRRFLNVAESALFSEILTRTQQNRSAAAKLLGLDRATLRTKLGANAS